MLAFGRGLHRFWGSSQPLPWRPVLGALAAPPVGSAVLLKVISWGCHVRNAFRRANEDKWIAVARAEQKEARAAAAPEGGDGGGATSVRQDQCFFWRMHTGAELDLFVPPGRERWSFEFKRTTASKLKRSVHSVWDDPRLTRLDVVHAGHLFHSLKK